jgi:hypothetical protein
VVSEEKEVFHWIWSSGSILGCTYRKKGTWRCGTKGRRPGISVAEAGVAGVAIEASQGKVRGIV